MIELLRAQRLEKGITQEQLAKALKVGQGFISKIETHERRIDILELRSICKAIGISFLDFARNLDNELEKENYEED